MATGDGFRKAGNDNPNASKSHSGGGHEEAIRDFLSALWPPPIRFKKFIIQTTTDVGGHSHDIVGVEMKQSTGVQGDRIDAGGVFCVIEVKASANSDQLLTCGSNATQEISHLAETRIPCFVVAYLAAGST